MNHAIRANYARIAVAHPEVACWRPSAGPTGASGRSDSGQTAAAPPKAFGAVARHSRGVTKSDAKKSLNSQNPPALSQPRWEPPERPFPALSPAAHRHGSYVSVCEGSERQQGGQLTYTLHSFRFCAESVLTAVDRAGSTATCVPQSTPAARGSVAQNARPASEVPAAAPRERAPHDLRHTVVSHVTCTQAVWGKIPERRSCL